MVWGPLPRDLLALGPPAPGTSCQRLVCRAVGQAASPRPRGPRADPGSPPRAHPLAVGPGPRGPPGGGAEGPWSLRSRKGSRSPRSLLAQPVTPGPAPSALGHPCPGRRPGRRPPSVHRVSVTLGLLCSGDEALARVAPAGGALWADLKGLLGAVGRHGGPTGKSPDARTRDDPQGLCAEAVS